MEDYNAFYKSICRLCLTQNNDEKMVSLIDNSSEDGLSAFGKATNIVTKVLLKKDDKLPVMMCFKCVYLLKHAIYFKLKCESTQQKLKRLLNSNVNSDLSEENIKENICNYVMYRHYFTVNTNSKSTSNNELINKRHKLDSDMKQNQNSSTDETKIDVNTNDNIYEFNDFLDSTENTEIRNDTFEEYSNEINNILDTIQDIINSEANVSTTSKRRKIKRQQQKYRPIIRNKERNLICNICHKVLANRLTYDHHMQRHNRCRFICDQCGKGFPVLAEMHMHQIARHGIGPYLQCDHCPYKAPRKLNLIEHLRIHTGERPFTCEKCGLTFRRRAIWRNHLVRHMEKKCQCTYCPRKFFTHSQMLAHCNNVHERVYMYMCCVCSVTYTKTETVRRHMVVKHSIPREKQGRILRITNGVNEMSV